jgi:hypothetical protein
MGLFAEEVVELHGGSAIALGGGAGLDPGRLACENVPWRDGRDVPDGPDGLWEVRGPKWPLFEQLVREISAHSGRSISHAAIFISYAADSGTIPRCTTWRRWQGSSGVPVTFFTDVGMMAHVMAEYELMAAMRDSRIREICLHAPRLDQQVLMRSPI